MTLGLRLDAMTFKRNAEAQEGASGSAMTPEPASKHEGAAVYRFLSLHATGTRVPDTILCGAVGEWRAYDG